MGVESQRRGESLKCTFKAGPIAHGLVVAHTYRLQESKHLKTMIKFSHDIKSYASYLAILLVRYSGKFTYT